MDFEKFNDFWGHSPFARQYSPIHITRDPLNPSKGFCLASEIIRLSDIFRTSRRLLEYDCSTKNFAMLRLKFRIFRSHKNFCIFRIQVRKKPLKLFGSTSKKWRFSDLCQWKIWFRSEADLGCNYQLHSGAWLWAIGVLVIFDHYSRIS